MLQYLRKVRVRFIGPAGELLVNPGADTDDQLRVRFDIVKSITGTANEANIRIHNLAEESRNKIGEEFTDVEIEAGYIPPNGGDFTGIIFIGQIRDVEHSRDDTDIISSITAGDGDRAIRKATISKTYPAGTPPELVVEDGYAAFEEQSVDRGEFIFPPMEPFIRPYSPSSAVSRELNVLGRGKKFYWSIQNNVMEVIPSDGYLPPITQLDKDRGMIGYPKITDNGIRVTSLINPEIRPNRGIRVISEPLDLDAEFRVGKIDYTGDNRGDAFLMNIHGEKIINDIVYEGIR